MPQEQKDARAARFKAFREKHWETQDDAARELEIRRELLSKYENGKDLLTGAASRAPFVRLGWPSDAIGLYLEGSITLVQLDALRRDPNMKPVVDFSDPQQWAAAVRGFGIDLGYEPDDVEAYIESEAKARVRPRADLIAAQLASFVQSLRERGTEPPSDAPPFLRAKRKRA